MSKESEVGRKMPGLLSLRLSKGDLGEGYLVGTVVVINAILITRLLVDGSIQLLWTPIWLTPGFVLVGMVYWLRNANLGSEQIWEVAKYSAFGLGLGMTLLVVIYVSDGSPIVSGPSTFRLGAAVSTLAMIGIFAGTTNEMYRSQRNLDLRNRVLRRVLRHDLRNDMTVVLCHLDDIESSLDDEHDEKVARARRKIEKVVDLTDKVRRIDVSTRADDETVPMDLVPLLQRRVDMLESTYPAVEINTDFPDRATAWVDGDFGVVIDSIVESAASGTGDGRLLFVLSVEGDTVCLVVKDRNGTVPKADLTAVQSGSETALEHARGVEMWLVHWLVEASDGDLTLDVEAGRMEITLDRAADVQHARSRLRNLLDWR